MIVENKETEYKDTEIGRIPKDWNVVRLSDVINTLPGFAFSSKFFSKEKGIPLIRIRDLGKNVTEVFYEGSYEEKYLVKEGDILVSMDGEFNVCLWKGPVGLLNQRVLKIWPKDRKQLDNLYLYYAIQKPLKTFELQIAATTVKHLLAKHLQIIKFPLPSSIKEQQKIAEILSTVDKAIQKVDEAIAKTERLKKGLMQELLTKGIGHKEFKDTEIGRIPKDWEVVQLGDALELCQYGLSVSLSEEGKYPIVRMDEIVDGYVTPTVTKYVDLDDKTFREFKLEKGDILFNRTNAPDLVGRTGIFLLEGDYVFASYLIRLRPKREIFDPHFLTFYLIFIHPKLKQLATRAVQQANINAATLKKVKVPRPELKEQQKIAEILSTIDKKLELERKRKDKLERIKKGLMNDLLTGKRRVKV